MVVIVAEITADQTYDIRREVLRDGRADADVAFDRDDAPGVFHLGALDGDELVGVATFAPRETPRRPGRVAWQLRGMAVRPRHQGRGAGRRLLEVAVDRLRAQGAEVLWANGRDSAQPFYEGLGWSVEGEGYVTEATGLPHHDVVLDL